MYTWTLDEIRAKPAEQIEIKKDAFCVYTTLHRTLSPITANRHSFGLFEVGCILGYDKEKREIFATEQGPYGEYPLHFTIYAVPEKTIIEKRTSLYAGTDWTWKRNDREEYCTRRITLNVRRHKRVGWLVGFTIAREGCGHEEMPIL
jgi:hypothetical protein